MRATLFFDDADYRIFINLLAETVERFQVPLLAYCLMPNHWHLVTAPASQGELSRAMHWLTTVHVSQWCKTHPRGGPGHVYQGRFKSIAVQPGFSLCRLLRYVERNALAASLTTRAEEWRWSSAYQRRQATYGPRLEPLDFLPEEEWMMYLNDPAPDPVVTDVIRRNLPFGDEEWLEARRARLGLPASRPRGRPWPSK